MCAALCPDQEKFMVILGGRGSDVLRKSFLILTECVGEHYLGGLQSFEGLLDLESFSWSVVRRGGQK